MRTPQFQIELALRAGNIAKTTLGITEMADARLCLLIVRSIAEQLAELDKWLRVEAEKCK